MPEKPADRTVLCAAAVFFDLDGTLMDHAAAQGAAPSIPVSDLLHDSRR